MNSIYISNAFSLQMLKAGLTAEAEQISREDAEKLVGLQLTDSGWSAEKDKRIGAKDDRFLPGISIIGHDDICSIINEELRLPELNPSGTLRYKVNRVSISLEDGDILVVGQYIGPRLAEGTKELPVGAEIKWYKVKILIPGK